MWLSKGAMDKKRGSEQLLESQRQAKKALPVIDQSRLPVSVKKPFIAEGMFVYIYICIYVTYINTCVYICVYIYIYIYV